MAKLIDQIPKPEKQHIKVLEVKKVMIPHPYCITPRHLTGKSMYLDKNAIKEAEKNNNAVCDICRKLVRDGRQQEVLSFGEYEEQLTLFLEVPKGNLNNIEGLHEYLMKIKPVLVKLKIAGIAFKQL